MGFGNGFQEPPGRDGLDEVADGAGFHGSEEPLGIVVDRKDENRERWPAADHFGDELVARCVRQFQVQKQYVGPLGGQVFERGLGGAVRADAREASRAADEGGEVFAEGVVVFDGYNPDAVSVRLHFVLRGSDCQKRSPRGKAQ